MSDLVSATLGADLDITLLGGGHDHVPSAGADYAWPAPDSHLGVWTVAAPAPVGPVGAWLAGLDAEAELGRLHWWALASVTQELLI